MRNFFLSPIYALFDPAFYREVLANWRTGRTVLFILYLVFFYVVVTLLTIFSVMNKFPQFFGQMNDQHIALQFLSSAPHEWQFGEEGVTLLDENKQSVNQWNFEGWFYVDTTQQGDFTPPGEYQLVMSNA